MSLYRNYKADENLETKGILLEFGINERTKKPIRFRVARAGGANKAFEKRLEFKTKPYRRQIQTDMLDKSIQDQLLKETYAETVVLGWEEVDDENGNPLEFNYENCMKIFTDLPDLYKALSEETQKFILFKAEILEKDLKN